ncbi:hypothetical protein M0802_014461 [Mischocyttarus mexicanus]|nr:hypothetical protein M0802_014461 [Mischocyttarus mexicanus]
MPVDLGFVEKCESWQLESRFFPSKVGGRPAWLDLKNIPKKEDLECEYCKNPCVFLCQIYAPYEEDDDAFHRILYVFICKDPSCCKINENGNLKVLRSQLNRFNPFYPSEPPIEKQNWRTDISTDSWCKTCCVCGISAPNHCSKCKIANYCCRNHQIYDWKHGHKQNCGNNVNISNSFLFPEYELVIESEEGINEDDEDCNEIEEKEMEKYKSMVQRNETGSFQAEKDNEDLVKMANADEDEVFARFHARIDQNPEQVVRYERNGQILYISGNTNIQNIPKCLSCGGERQFEFQIGVYLLYLLVKKSCMPKEKYAMEYIWKQDILSDKIDSSAENKNDSKNYIYSLNA